MWYRGFLLDENDCVVEDFSLPVDTEEEAEAYMTRNFPGQKWEVQPDFNGWYS